MKFYIILAFITFSCSENRNWRKKTKHRHFLNALMVRTRNEYSNQSPRLWQTINAIIIFTVRPKCVSATLNWRRQSFSSIEQNSLIAQATHTLREIKSQMVKMFTQPKILCTDFDWCLFLLGSFLCMNKIAGKCMKFVCPFCVEQITRSMICQFGAQPKAFYHLQNTSNK